MVDSQGMRALEEFSMTLKGLAKDILFLEKEY